MIYKWNDQAWRTLADGPSWPPAAVLLAGPPGIGKRAFAQTLAQALLCETPVATREPCNRCASCRLFARASHPDFRLIEPLEEDVDSDGARGATGAKRARSISVAQVRELADFLGVTSHFGGRKTVLVQPAERLHPSAANALLKTLEEPPPATLFVLVSDRPQHVLATIRSRCFRIDLSTPPADVAMEWLKAEGVADPAATLPHAGFAPMRAQELSRTDFAERRAVLNDQFAASHPNAADLARVVTAEELPLLCALLYRWCYDVLALRLTGVVRYNRDYAKSLQRLADSVDVLRLQSLFKEVLAATRSLDHPLNARLAIERLAIGYVRATQGGSL